jgi:cation diffusion facilitator CzcD-associated flavoprotein CzcO
MTDESGTIDGAERLRERYRLEREKREAAHREDLDELTGDLAHYRDDPYTKAMPRPAVHDEVDAVVVGAGFSGLLTSVRLRQAGLERTAMIDMAGDVGGVWYWNRYPGAMCDIDSRVYLPLLEEMGYTPQQRYSLAPEILAYTQSIARKFDLYKDAFFHTAVTSMRWDEDRERWIIDTDRGDEIVAKYVVLGNGPFTRLKLPAIPGLETFKGHSFHTSRWDYDYTGGDSTSILTKLADKRVGMIGTGATGVQVVSPLGRSAQEVFVFQRTPSTIAPRDNAKLDPEWVSKQEPGWQREWIRNFTAILSGAPTDVDLVDDGWTDLYKTVQHDPRFKAAAPEEAARIREQADMARMDEIRARIDRTVTDRETAEHLKPYYPYFCKRACFHDEYLEAFNRDNVHLVDTNGQGIDEIYEDGIIVAGQKYELDCIVFATGFEAITSYTHRLGFDITGRNGRSLTEKWKKGIRSLHGLMTNEFPNLFYMPTPNSQAVVTTNFAHLIGENAGHIAYIVSEVEKRQAQSFEVTAEAEQGWVDTILDKRVDKRASLRECTPGRNNFEGDPDNWPAQNTNYGPGPLPFLDLLDEWRRAGDLAGLRVESRSEAEATA